MKPQTACELCGGVAAVHCKADEAYLCWRCDASVHGANFLVSRHVRTVTCSSCRSLDPGRTFSGAGPPPIRSRCNACGLDEVPASSPSSSSSCVSTADSVAAPAKSGGGRRWEEVVLANWSRRMGMREWRGCAVVAKKALVARREAVAGVPFRVCAAAALWLAARAAGGGGGGGGDLLRRLEACSGVPAKLILLVEARLVCRSRAGLEEGWAESS